MHAKSARLDTSAQNQRIPSPAARESVVRVLVVLLLVGAQPEVRPDHQVVRGVVLLGGERRRHAPAREAVRVQEVVDARRGPGARPRRGGLVAQERQVSVLERARGPLPFRVGHLTCAGWGKAVRQQRGQGFSLARGLVEVAQQQHWNVRWAERASLAGRRLHRQSPQHLPHLVEPCEALAWRGHEVHVGHVDRRALEPHGLQGRQDRPRVCVLPGHAEHGAPNVEDRRLDTLHVGLAVVRRVAERRHASV
mmetsp:Transcript_80073/g.248489  ORF Transcript_80073/g.248489 Transcript_80073/m.248489 type:complete len:251 (-) Transcript_80073:247-999(-)